MGARIPSLAQRVDAFLSGGRLMGIMCAAQVAGLLAYSLMLPAGTRVEGLVLCGVCLLAAGLVWRLKDGALTFDQPRSFLLGVLLAGGVLYAVGAPAWPDERSILAAARSAAESGLVGFLRDYAAQPWAGTRHPPLMPLLNGALLRLMPGGSYGGLLVLRMAGLLLAAAALLVVERAVMALSGEAAGLLAAAFLLGMPATLRVGATALNDFFVAGLVTAALFCLLRLARTSKLGWAALAGSIIGLALLVKYTAVVFFAVGLVWLVLLPDLRRVLITWRGLLLVVGLPALLLGGWLVMAARLGVFAQQSAMLYGYAGQVVSNEFGRWLLARTLFFSLPAALGLQTLPLLVKAAARLIVRPSQAAKLAWGWAGAVTLPVLLTLPDFRYLLAAFPALAGLTALALEDEPTAVRARLAVFGLICCAAMLWVLNRAAPSSVVPFQ